MSANRKTKAPTGRKKIAQSQERSDDALGHESQNTASTDGAKEGGTQRLEVETGKELLARILIERRQNWQGRGQYKEPAAPDTTSLPQLPAGWTWASLEQVSRSSSYGTSAKCSPDNPGPPVLRIPNIAGGRIDLTDLKFAGADEPLDTGNELAPGDLLIIRTNGSKNLIGRSAVVRTKLDRATSYASYLIRFRLFGSPPLFDWVGTIWDVFFLRAWIEQRAATSAGQHNISMSVLSTMPLPLPPLAEQCRIVAEIEKQFTRLEAGVAALQRVQANLERYRAAVLKAACEGRLVPTEAELRRTADHAEGADQNVRKSASSAKSAVKTPAYETGAELLARILAERRQNWQGRGQYKEPAEPDTAKLPALPEGWTWASVEQTAAAIVDCPHSTPKWTDRGRMCVRTTEFRAGLLDLTEVRFVSEESFQERIARLEPRAGDILYSREGGILGIACPVPDGVSLCLGQRMMLIRPSGGVISHFVMGWLNSTTILNLVKSLTSGSASPHLNVGEIRQFPIPLPPLAEQTRIVAEVERRLSVVEELEAVVSANLQRATRLRQAILQKAFTGELV